MVLVYGVVRDIAGGTRLKPMMLLPRILRQALAPALRRLWPLALARRLPRPFQTNPLAPHTRRAVYATQAFVVLGDPGDRGAA